MIGLKLKNAGRVKVWIRNINDPILKEVTAIQDVPTNEPTWAPLIAGARFADNPSASTLARELRWLSNFWPEKGLQYFYVSFGWPFDACLSRTSNKMQVLALAEKAENGELGDIESWLLAEKRWRYKGITEQDVLASTCNWPFDRQIQEVGFPFAGSRISFSSLTSKTRFALWNLLYSHRDKTTNPIRSWYADTLLLLMTSHPAKLLGATGISPTLIKELILERGREFYDFELFDAFSFLDQLDDDWLDFFEWYGNEDFNFYLSYPDRTLKYVNQIALAYKSEPSRVGLLNILAILVLSGARVTVPNELLNRALQADDEKVRISALLVQFSQGKCNHSEIKEIAKQLMTASPHYSDVYILALFLVRKHFKRASDSASFAIAVRDEILARGYGELESTVRVLNELMRARTSPLVKRRYWEELGLPALL